jgi:hypothetical protein
VQDPETPPQKGVAFCVFGPFSVDEYQACSGIGHGVDIKELVKSKDPAGAKQAAEKPRNSV